ncbi:MAG: penicillin-binding protein, partial [Erysipelotrichaceae bacterium]|nr:penicillin-binding protein [Erysipelotrichaceae bacterium]
VGIGGGRNYNGARLLNRATSQFKQPGSCVKPFLSYALAFEHLGWSLDHVVVDKPYTFPMESRVLRNFDGKYRGDVPLKDAVGTSLNIPAIITLEEVQKEIGTEAIVDYMQSLGFTRVTDDNFHLSFAIGGTWFESTPYEIAGAQAAMMNGGVYNKPHTISKIVMQDGTVYYPTDQNRRVLSSGSAWMVTELLYNNVYGPYFNYMQILKRDYPVYAKTGTTDWGSDGLQYGIPQGAAKDKWMIASTSEYTNALWVGYDKAVSGEGTWFSSYKSSLNIPGNISKLILDACEESSGVPKKEITRPSDVEEITYVYGSYPYAKWESWMSVPSVTSYVSSAGKKDLVDIKDHKVDTTYNGISATQGADGSINIGWSVGEGGCYGDTKDISLIDQYNNVPATGACLFDYSWVLGNNISYWATISCDGYQIASITSETASYSGYVGDLYGNVSVCGGFSTGSFSSESKCTSFTYQYDDGWDDAWGPRPW